jgi:hypothetical protein
MPEGAQMARKSKGSNEQKAYPVGLAGESNYQGAICVCREGQPVRICHEIGNPHDDDALVVISIRNETIGYIPRSNWLRDAIYEQGVGCEATILSIHGEREPMGVVIEVRLTEGELDARDYEPAKPSSSKSNATACLVAGGLVLTPFFARLF